MSLPRPCTIFLPRIQCRATNQPISRSARNTSESPFRTFHTRGFLVSDSAAAHFDFFAARIFLIAREHKSPCSTIIEHALNALFLARLAAFARFVARDEPWCRHTRHRRRKHRHAVEAVS